VENGVIISMFVEMDLRGNMPTWINKRIYNDSNYGLRKMCRFLEGDHKGIKVKDIENW